MESELRVLPADHTIYQERCFGYSIEEVAAKFNILPDEVQEAVERYCQAHGMRSQRSTAERKALALARLDHATKALMPRLVNGDITAIHTYLKIQEREAKLTGMDTDKGPAALVRIDIPWLTQERLSYRNQGGEVIENVTDITPILDVKRALENPPKD